MVGSKQRAEMVGRSLRRVSTQVARANIHTAPTTMNIATLATAQEVVAQNFSMCRRPWRRELKCCFKGTEQSLSRKTRMPKGCEPHYQEVTASSQFRDCCGRGGAGRIRGP